VRQDKRPSIRDPSSPSPLLSEEELDRSSFEDLVDSNHPAAEVGSHLVEGIRRHRIAVGTEGLLVGSILGSTW